MRLFITLPLVLGVIAQLGERLNGIQEVRSSILLSSTSFNLRTLVLEGERLLHGDIAQLGERQVRNL